MKNSIFVCVYITTELDTLKFRSRERHVHRIQNVLSEFSNDYVHIICRENDFDRISRILSHPNHRITHFSLQTLISDNFFLPKDINPLFLLQDTNPCVSRKIIEFWHEKSSFLHGRKIINVQYPFQVSYLKADFTIITADLSKSLIQSGIPLESWLDFAQNPEPPSLIARESVFYNPVHLPEVYKRYREDIDFPESFLIEPTTHCTFKCCMCPYHSDRYSSPVISPYIKREEFQHIDFELFRRIVDEITSYDVVSLTPQFRGEPFLHPELLKMLRYAREKGMDNIAFPTNGFALNDEIIEELLDIDIACLIFSFDGLTKDTYLKIRQNSNFERVRDNIFKLRERRDKRNLKRPLIQMTFVDLPENREEREDYVKFWTTEVERVKINIGLTYEELHSNQPFGFSIDFYEHRPPCPLILSNAAVTAGGKMILCHTDSTESTVLADLSKSTIKEAYDSDLSKIIRDAHMSGNFSIREVCKGCQIWKSDFFKNYDDPEYIIYGGTWWTNYVRKTKANGAQKESCRKSAGFLRRFLQKIGI